MQPVLLEKKIVWFSLKNIFFWIFGDFQPIVFSLQRTLTDDSVSDWFYMNRKLSIETFMENIQPVVLKQVENG